MSRLDDLDLSTGAGARASAGPLPDPSEARVSPAADEPLARTRTAGGSSGSPAGAPGLIDLPLAAPAAQIPGRVILRTPAPVVPGAEAVPAPAEGRAAPLPARGAAFAADAALVLLLAAAALLAATAGRGQPLRIQGLIGTAAFAVYLSFFSTVVPLILFGKTVGMALTGLTARAGKGAPLTIVESARRWLGTALTVAGLGVPLLVTRRYREAPSPADRLSGRPLAVEEIDS